jgi:hypothetical protein
VLDKDGFEIRYTVSFIINRRNKSYLKYDGKFKVVKQIDWNLLFPEMQKPVLLQSTAAFRNLISASVPMTLKVALLTSRFAVGQDVPITAYIDNDSEQSIDRIEFEIIKIFKCRVRVLFGESEDTRNYEMPVYKNKCSGQYVSGRYVNETQSYNTIIKIPKLPPTTLKTCKIFDIAYLLRITAKMKVKLGNTTNALMNLGKSSFFPVVDIPIVIIE